MEKKWKCKMFTNKRGKKECSLYYRQILWVNNHPPVCRNFIPIIYKWMGGKQENNSYKTEANRCWGTTIPVHSLPLYPNIYVQYKNTHHYRNYEIFDILKTLYKSRTKTLLSVVKCNVKHRVIE